MDGMNFGPITFIRRSADTPAIRAHEAEHARWFWRNPLFYGLMCLFSHDYHLASEVAAYKAQIAAGDSLLGCAKILQANYGFDINMNKALELLQ
jgi:hypothetical protein